MAITSGSELTLGVLFKGRVDQAFQKATADLRGILGGLAGSAGNVTRAFDGVSKKAKSVSHDMQGVGKHAMKTAQGFQRFANSLKFIAAYSAAATAIWGTVNAIKAGAQAIVDYDQALKNLQAITGATDVEISALGDVIKNVASTTKFSATEVGEAAILLGQAGFTASESLDSIGAVANLATGTLTSMETSADLLTTAIRAFSLQAGDSSRVADIFASAVNKSKLTIDKLRISFNYLGPIANQIGISLEETAAGAMLLANAGLRASTVGTGFRRVLQQLVKPSKAMRVLIDGLGGDLDKLNPATNSLSDVMGELEKILGKNVSQAERARRAFALFGLRGAQVAAAFAQAGSEGFNKMYDEVLRVGTASKMAEKQMEGLGVMIKNTMDKLQNLAIAIGEGGIASAFRAIIYPIRDFIDLLTRLVETNLGRATVAVVSLTLAITALRTALRFVIITLGAYSLGKPISMMKHIAARVGLMTIAANTAGAAFTRMWAIIAGGPLGLFAAFSVLVVGISAYNKSISETVDELRKVELEKQKVIDKLLFYKEALSSVNEGTKEYKSILERLVQDFPELASAVDLAAGAFRDGGKALDEFFRQANIERVEALSNTLDTLMTALERSEARLDRYQKRMQAKREGKGGKGEGLYGGWVGGFIGSLTDEQVTQAESVVKKLEEDIKTSGESAEEQWKSVAENLRALTGDIFNSYDNLFNFFINKMGWSVKKSELYAKKILQQYEKIKLADKQLIASSSGFDNSVAKLLDKQKLLLSSYNLEDDKINWLDLFENQTEERQVELVKTLSEMRDKIEKFKKDFGDELTPEQEESEIRRIIKKTYEDFVAYEDSKQKAARTSAQKILEEWKRLYQSEKDAELQAVDSWYANEEQKIKGSKYYADAHIKLVQATEMKKAEIRNKYAWEDATKRKEYEDLQESFRKADLEAQWEASEDIDEIRRLRMESAKKYALEEVRTGKLSIDEYYQYLKMAREADVISAEEEAEQKKRISKDYFQSLKDGWKKALGEVRTLSELMYDLGTEAPGRLAGGLTDSIWDFVEGTKSAKEAMRDFAKDMLEWLAKAILKWTILRALQNFTNSGNNSWVTSMMSGIASGLHGGGIAGREATFSRFVDSRIFKHAPRFHDGLMPGEVPAILKKGEGVFTPEQMKALGGGRQVVFNSNVTVQVQSDSRSGSANDSAKNDALGRDIARVINNEVDRNIRKNLRPGGIIDERLRKMRY